MSSRGAGRQSMSELKLRRLLEHNQRLREDLARPRVKVSEASASLIAYCRTTKDHLVPSVWGPAGRSENPYETQSGGGKCCTVQ
ncbi:guanine nucleotide-binding protein subunit gamma [Coprinopsis sp. MPI-PUGE-AT-0042]|nr:guanine nucleotide-binding protein subunit gamma [Coprinopsis sp. MPI-PUGE-AT-0042]